MRLLALCCQALERRFRAAAADSLHDITVQVNPQGLHTHPTRLHNVLQEAVNAAASSTYDAVLLVYGLCGAAAHGLVARSIPLIIPRAHDCVTLYLGSRCRYQQLFDENPGTYWYIQDYTEAQSGGDMLAPGGLENRYQEYIELYGADNADYLMQVLGGWNPHYSRAIYVDTGHTDAENYAALVQERAVSRGWTYQHEMGSNRLLEQLAQGDWDESAFLVVRPGHYIEQTHDTQLVKEVRNGQ